MHSSPDLIRLPVAYCDFISTICGRARGEMLRSHQEQPEPSDFTIDPAPIQQLAPPPSTARFEGVAFSRDGAILAAATSDSNMVLLFRKGPEGHFEDQPFSAIAGPASRLDYPHDLAFSWASTPELLAVAQRAGAICLYGQHADTNEYGPGPIYEIGGAAARLQYSDGVAFVPPDDAYVAACNLARNTITRRFGVLNIRQVAGGCEPR